MNQAEMMQRLKRMARLSLLDDEVLADLARVVTTERHPPGAVICRQGELEDKSYAIELGQVLVRTSVGEQEVDVARLSEGDVFGERALVEALPRTATIVAETTVDLLALERADYQNLLQKHPSLKRILVGPEILPLLRQVPLFSRLSEEELNALSEHVGVLVYPHGRSVVEQGDMGTTMYMVIKGELVAYRLDERGRRRPVRALKEGESFGETSLLVGEPRDATVVTRKYTELCYLHKPSFDEFLEAHPAVRDRLQVRPDVERKWKARRFPGQNPDEIIAIKDSKHWMAFVHAVGLPALLLGLAGAIVVAIAVLGPSLIEETTGLEGVLIILTILWTLAAVIVLAWHWIDWKNDYYIVTSQRVVHIERELLRATTTDVVPIERVQSVELARDLEGALWGYGRVRVTTAGAAGGLMELIFVRDPEAFQEAIFEQIRRAGFRAVAAEHAEIRRMIRQGMGVALMEEEIEVEPPPAREERLSWLQYLAQGRLVQRLRQIISEFGVIVLLHRPHLPRQEIRQADQVIWRKHWWVLLNRTWRPLLPCLVLFVLIVAAVAGWLGLYVSLGFSKSLFGWALLPLIPFFFVFLGKLVWEMEDWRNDQYIVTDTHIIDIERTPFLLKESKNQARLENIQTIKSSTKNFWASLLKLGDVTIETAGEGTFTFAQVRNPAKVQAEIEKRREAYRDKMHRQEADRRRVEIVRWLSVYSDVTREEQARARREARQPTLEESERQDESGQEV